MADDITVEILKAIRDEGRKTNEQLEALRTETTEQIGALRGEVCNTNERLDAFRADANQNFAKMTSRLDAFRVETNQNFAKSRDEMIARDAELEMRWTAAVKAATRDSRDTAAGQQELKERVEQCERDISELKKRSG